MPHSYLNELRAYWQRRHLRRELLTLWAADALARPTVASIAVSTGVPRRHVAAALLGMERAGFVFRYSGVPDGDRDPRRCWRITPDGDEHQRHLANMMLGEAPDIGTSAEPEPS